MSTRIDAKTSGVSNAPMTYMVGGKQYVLAAANGGLVALSLGGQ